LRIDFGPDRIRVMNKIDAHKLWLEGVQPEIMLGFAVFTLRRISTRS
jgi:hypothetical protein